MRLTTKSFSTLFGTSLAAWVLFELLSPLLPQPALLGYLWKLIFITSPLTALCWNTRTSYLTLLENTELSESELRRIADIVRQRLETTNVLTVLGVLVMLLLAMATLMPTLTLEPATISTYIQLTLCLWASHTVGLLITICSGEVRDFQKTLTDRKRKKHERQRLLDKLNNNEA